MAARRNRKEEARLSTLISRAIDSLSVDMFAPGPISDAVEKLAKTGADDGALRVAALQAAIAHGKLSPGDLNVATARINGMN